MAKREGEEEEKHRKQEVRELHLLLLEGKRFLHRSTTEIYRVRKLPSSKKKYFTESAKNNSANPDAGNK